jgi:hypothetical protein
VDRGKKDLLPELAADLIRSGVALIVSMAFKNRAKTAELESGRPAAARTDYFDWDSYAAHLGVGALRVLEWGLGLVL